MDCKGSVAVTKLPLDEVNFGTWRYQTTEEESIALFHREGSSNLYVTTHMNGTNNAPPATFTLRDITALDLALVNSVPGALESMTVRCALETDRGVIYESDTAEIGMACELTCHLVTMKVSVNKAAELRDILMQLKTGDNRIFVSDQPSQRVAGTESQLDALPAWVFYIPAWLYTRKVRIVLEKLLLMYTVFSVFWACWQLYRHVNIIHLTFQPFIDLLKEHLAPTMETFDTALVVITEIWTHWFSPLNIFMGKVLTPVLLSLKSGLTPFLGLCTLMTTNISRLLASSSPVLMLKEVLQSFSVLGTHLWRVVTALMWPFHQLCLYVMSSSLAVVSFDTSRVRFNWVLGMVTSSVKAIGNGTVKLFSYLLRKKQRKVHLQKTPTRLHMGTPRTRKTLSHVQSSEQDKRKT